MRIAITGATGFVGGHLTHALLREGHEFLGGHLADTLLREGHEIVAITRKPMPSHPRLVVHAVGLDDEDALARAMENCDAVAHCAGINRQLGQQTYDRVHVRGTRNDVEAAKRSGIRRLALISFLRARPDCGSAYHETKWAAEEIVRTSGLDYTILKCGVIYGRGDHMLDHLSLSLRSLPMFAFVGRKERAIRPVAVADVIRILRIAIVDGRLPRVTMPVVGPDTLMLSEAVRLVAEVIGRRPLFVRWPIWCHAAMAWVLEKTMTVPIVSRAQVRILAEGVAEPVPPFDSLPDDLVPHTRFDAHSIAAGLPTPRRIGLRDCRCLASLSLTCGGH